MNAKAIIFGCAGTELTSAEIDFFTKTQPWGFILFARNMQTETQVRQLTNALRKTVKHQPHIFIDEEGGRVSRLRSIGGWIGPPAAAFYASGQDMQLCQQAVRANYRAIGARLAALGFTADCAPVLDIPVRQADPIIGDRAFCNQAQQIIPLAKAAIDGLNDAGISEVIKHIPGHGRANVDSHLSLPVVSTEHKMLSDTDFAPFQALASAKMAMTAHIVYAALDPDFPATTSPTIIQQIIRDEIGFDGLLMSDDLEMKALGGSLPMRARQALAAGCDMLLHCSGDLAAMRLLADVVPALQGPALARARRASPDTGSGNINPEQAILEAKNSFLALQH
ncbi:beta-N-acetylglucosaminidase [hydrothermal vent metagenome]|uniref:beta-N-acetylhexosaminidase n=1 Tax=hydrothermal vent metagenome TaxID=652676 RepID=A0A3B0T016_9ZZZZ